jgi:hypothetical protein
MGKSAGEKAWEYAFVIDQGSGIRDQGKRQETKYIRINIKLHTPGAKEIGPL